MNKKAVVYFVSAFIIISSVSVYFISEDLLLRDNTYTLSGEYDIWEQESSSGICDTVESAAEPETEEPENDILIDINSASEEDLIKIKGIGKVIAGNIISYRDNAGGFNNTEEIMNVKGIGEKTFLKIKKHIYVTKYAGTSFPAEPQTDNTAAADE